MHKQQGLKSWFASHTNDATISLNRWIKAKIKYLSLVIFWKYRSHTTQSVRLLDDWILHKFFFFRAVTSKSIAERKKNNDMLVTDLYRKSGAHTERVSKVVTRLELCALWVLPHNKYDSKSYKLNSMHSKAHRTRIHKHTNREFNSSHFKRM